LRVVVCCWDGGAGKGFREERKEKRLLVLLVWRERSGREERKVGGSVVPSGERRVGSMGESVRRVLRERISSS